MVQFCLDVDLDVAVPSGLLMDFLARSYHDVLFDFCKRIEYGMLYYLHGSRKIIHPIWVYLGMIAEERV